MVAVLIKDLKKTFQKGGRIAINNLSCQIGQGEITGIVGPDGAGKTTLLRIISGLMTIDSGICQVFSFDIQKEAEKVQSEFLGYLPQKFGLYEDLTVAQNITLYSKLQGISHDDPIIKRLLDFSGLHPFLSRLVGNLSGGMKQKLGLMTTMLRRPKILLLDEPTIGVDPISQNELWKMIYELHEQGITIVVSTSYLTEAERCQKVIVLNEGQSIFSGRPDTFKEIVKGKTYYFENIGDIKRQVLDQLLGQNGIIDTIVEGEKIKVTFDMVDPVEEPKAYGLRSEAILTLREPDFEDAFIYKLGGVPKRPPMKFLDHIIKLKDNQDTPAIEAIGLSKYFGKFKAVDQNSFTVKKGEIFGLLGPNGAGKSTTFKMLCGLIRPSEGEASIGGVLLKDLPGVARGKIGYMAQKFSLYNNMTVIQNLNFFSGIYGVENSETIIEQMINVFNLEKYRDLIVGDLPLGYKQRLALSCALMHRPEVLFLDEPTSGVDPLTRREFWHQINLLAASGVAVLVSTHLMDEAEFCDRIGLIFEGKLRVVDTPEGLKKQVNKAWIELYGKDKVAKMKEPTLVDAFSYFCNPQKQSVSECASDVVPVKTMRTYIHNTNDINDTHNTNTHTNNVTDTHNTNDINDTHNANDDHSKDTKK